MKEGPREGERMGKTNNKDTNTYDNIGKLNETEAQRPVLKYFDCD